MLVKGLGLFRNPKQATSTLGRDTAEGLVGCPLDKGISKNDRTIAAKKKLFDELAGGNLILDWPRTQSRYVGLAQCSNYFVRIGKIFPDPIQAISKNLSKRC